MVVNCLILLIFVCPLHANQFVVWNVGQGLATSLISKEMCIHFDFGGEKIDLEKVLKRCKTKKNIISISHFDNDHISMIPLLRKFILNLCHTRIDFKTYRKANYFLKNIDLCSDHFIDSNPSYKYLFRGLNTKSKNENENSYVSIIKAKIIHPGDSTKKMEKIWARHPNLKNGQILILGHHGSKTSTSKKLLDKLKNLKLSITSARKAKYGHPHRKVTNLLKTKKIPNLLTEDWGNIMIEL